MELLVVLIGELLIVVLLVVEVGLVWVVVLDTPPGPALCVDVALEDAPGSATLVLVVPPGVVLVTVVVVVVVLPGSAAVVTFLLVLVLVVDVVLPAWVTLTLPIVEVQTPFDAKV